MTRQQQREQEDKNLLKTLVIGLLAAIWLVAYGAVGADELRDRETAARIEIGPGMAREIGGTR